MLREIRKLIRLGSKLWMKAPKSGPVRVTFVIQSAEVWPSVASVYHACARNPAIDATVVSTAFIHDSARVADPDQFLCDQGIPFVTDYEYSLLARRPDIVFLQNPYDSTRNTKFRSQALRELDIKIAYVPYGLEVGGGAQNIAWQYNLEVQRHAWRIFARSERHKRMFDRYCDSGSSHVVVTGHPKFDRANPDATAPLRWAENHKLRGRQIILWNAHFTVATPPTLWSTYQLFSEHIFSFFKKRTDVALIFRPHPLLFERMKNEGLLSASSEQELRTRLANSDNIMLDESPDYLPAFRAADALMSDAGSFLLEFLPTLKPILYLMNPHGPGLNEEGDITHSYYTAQDPESIDRFIDMVSAGRDPLRNDRIALIPEFLHRIDGKAGERIAQHLAQYGKH